MKASPMVTPVRSRAAINSRASAAFNPMGFSHKYVLARFGRADGPRNVQMIRQRIIDGVDFGVGQQLLIRPVGAGDA
jgi:hypothetical protein